MLIDDSTNQQNMLREWANPLPPAEPSFSAWSFAKAGGKASVAGALNYFGALRDFSNNIDQVHAGEVAAREKRLGLPASQPYIIPGGGEFRRKADTFMPDPETASQADHVIANLSSGLTQAVGSVLTFGPAAGATVFGLTQGDDAYQRMLEKNPNIDKAAALKVATVTGISAGAGVLIPMAGATVAKTLGLVAAGGPGLFATQEALSRNILQQAGATAEAAQHDPTDPLGLALSLAIPGVFGGLHIRSLTKDNTARLAATVKQIESGGNRFGADGQLLTSPKGAQGEMQVMPGTATDPGYGVAPARDSSPEELARVGRDYLAAMSHKYGDNDKALAAYNAGPGAVDAAVKAHGADWLAHMPDETQKYVTKANKLLGDHASEVIAKDPAAVDAARVKVGESVLHDALPEVGGAREAVVRAADLVAEGDIAGAERSGRLIITPAERDANFKAWFGDSKVVDDVGQPQRMYHGTAADFDSFGHPEDVASMHALLSPWVQDTNGDWAKGKPIMDGRFFFTDSPRLASDYAEGQNHAGEGGGVLPVYLSLKNPLVIDAKGSSGRAKFELMEESIGKAIDGGHDGLIVKNVVDALALEPGMFTKPTTVAVSFKQNQIKSAIGNSGRFDPHSASLTDPIHEAPQSRPAADVQPAQPQGINRIPEPDSITAEPPKPAAKTAEPGAMSAADTASLKTLADEQPDMRVTLPGHDEPMRLADALETAKKEADLIKSDAELVRAAVACALQNGAAIGAAA